MGGRTPLVEPYFKKGLCPVNVHWHLGSEHRSAGQYDETGKSPHLAGINAEFMGNGGGRRLAGELRYGYACQKYDANDPKFTTPYNWQHCIDMHVGETYEVHWPHSVLGACNTPYQYQSKFYDGIFCRYDTTAHAGLTAQQIASAVGVQSQVFTIVNDETYYYPNLMKGMIVANEYGEDVAFYTGSTTGTSRNNDDSCSAYSPITWQVDRTCHLISASSFDKMCADMKAQADDMTDDLYAHGSRTLVDTDLSAWMWDPSTGKPAHLP